jgi:hypothetical protein
MQKTAGRIAPQVTELVANALHESSEYNQYSLQEVDDNFKLDEVVGRRLQNAFRRVLESYGLRKGPSVQDSYLPYQDLLSVELKEGIENGTIGLVSMANEWDVCTKYVSGVLFSKQNLESARVPMQRLLPFSTKMIHVGRTNMKMKSAVGDHARGILFNDLWECVSPTMVAPFQGEPPTNASDPRVPANVKRFDLITALMTLRTCAFSPITPVLDDAFYYECPQNTIGVNAERYDHCGPMFKGAKNLVEAWNVTVHLAHGNPRIGTARYEDLQPDLFTTDDLKRALGAISLLVNKHPEETANQAKLFFTNKIRADGNTTTSPEKQEFRQHAWSIDSAEKLNQRLETLSLVEDTRAAGKVERHEAKVEVAEVVTYNMEVNDGYKTKNFWERPKDITVTHVYKKEDPPQPMQTKQIPAQNVTQRADQEYKRSTDKWDNTRRGYSGGRAGNAKSWRSPRATQNASKRSVTPCAAEDEV